MHTGQVESFDAHVGLGIVANEAGERYSFHCTAISDGSREIEPGRAVSFLVAPGGPGIWEARSVVPLD